MVEASSEGEKVVISMFILIHRARTARWEKRTHQNISANVCNARRWVKRVSDEPNVSEQNARMSAF